MDFVVGRTNVEVFCLPHLPSPPAAVPLPLLEATLQGFLKTVQEAIVKVATIHLFIRYLKTQGVRH